MGFARFGNRERAVRVLAKVIIFVTKARRQSLPSEVSLQINAERLITLAAQAEFYKDEITATLDSERPARHSHLHSYRLFIDGNGFLRAHTRLTHSPNLTYDAIHPTVIPGRSVVAHLLIFRVHRMNAHLRVGTVLNMLWRRFWIVRGRQLTMSLLRGCTTCRKTNVTPAPAVQGPLPEQRTSLTAPLTTAGLDFAGPLYTRSRDGTSKNYVALFTCASVRAIHLELVPAMTTVQTHLAPTTLHRDVSSLPSHHLG